MYKLYIMRMGHKCYAVVLAAWAITHRAVAFQMGSSCIREVTPRQQLVTPYIFTAACLFKASNTHWGTFINAILMIVVANLSQGRDRFIVCKQVA